MAQHLGTPVCRGGDCWDSGDSVGVGILASKAC